MTTSAAITMSWRGRLLSSALAIFGTAAYALSFSPVAQGFLPVSPRSGDIAGLAIAVSLAAGAAWLILGIIITIEPKRTAPWADISLRTMTIGTCWLLVGALMNLLLPWNLYWLFIVHPVLLIASDIDMTRQFLRRAKRAGFSTSHALALWVLGLHVPFVAILLVLINWRVLP